MSKLLGNVSAYAYAKSKGYTGTEDEFAELMASYAHTAEDAEQSAQDSEAWAVGKRDGVNVEATDDTYHNNAKYYADKAKGSADHADETVSGAIAGIQAEGTAQVTAVNGAGATQLNTVNTAGSTQVSAINTAGTAKVDAVNTAGATQVNAVNTAGTTQVSAVNAKGQEVLDSIPDDYETVVEDVSDLESALNDSNERIAVLEKLEKGEGFTPEEIQMIAASGHADEYFAIGDIIYIDWTDKVPSTPVTYSVPHVVTHFGDIEDEQGVTHPNAMWLMWMYATPQALPFDAPEIIVATEETFLDGFYYYTKNADGSYQEETVTVGDTIPEGTTYYKHVRSGMTGRIRYGSNDWSQSAYRQWLNSDANAGEWWTAQHESDVAPAQVATYPGFLSGYSEDWLAIIKPVKVVTALNTICDGGVDVVTYDRFFLPSIEQMYGAPQKAGVEGDYWEYWKNETGLPSRSNGSSTDTNPARQIPAISNPGGAAVSCRLRSAYRSSTYSVWLVSTAGYLRSHFASNAYRAQPACVIY